ncbi:MAG: glycosyltransferase family 39 protein [Nitrolancea sp.]
MNVRFRRPDWHDATHLLFPAGLLLTLLLAGVVLLYRVGSLPAGFLNAEAANGLLAREASGHGSALISQVGDRSPLLAALIALIGRPFGFDIATARLGASLAGLGTVLFTSLWLRRIFGPAWGLAGGLMLAGSFWFILFSRLALSPIAGALALSFLLWCLSEALERGARLNAFIWYGLAGLGAGLGYISDSTARVLPFILLIALVSAAFEHRASLRHHEVVGLLFALLVGLAVAGPLIRHSVNTPTHLSFWTPTPGLLGTHVSSWQGALSAFGTALARLGWPLSATLGLNLPDVAVFGPFLLLWAIVGLGVLVINLRQRLVATAAVGGLVLLASAAAIIPVHPGRLLTVLPLLIALPVAGCRFLYQQSPSNRYRVALIGLIALMLAGNIGWSSWRYFGDWAGSDTTASAFSASVSDSLNAVASLPDEDPVFYSASGHDELRRYLAPPSAGGAHQRIDFDGGEMLPIPADGSGYVVAPQAVPVAPTLLQAVGLSRLAELSTQRYDVYRLDQRARDQLPLSIPTTTFTGGPRFLGHQLAPSDDGKLNVVVAWELPGDGIPHTLRVRLRPVDGPGETQIVDVILPGDLLDHRYDLLRLVTLKAPASGTSADLSIALLDAGGRLLAAPGVDTDGYLFLNRYTFSH